MKAFLRLLSVLMVLSLISGCSASVTGTGTAAEEETAVQTDNSDGLFLSLTEGTSESLAFPLTKEQASRVEEAGADKVTWTLHRTETYANPADGNFIPLHGEDKMFPNEQETIDFATIRFNDMYDYEQPFSMERFETSLDGSTLKLDFTTTPVATQGKVGIPHESGGRFLDICGEFSLTAELDGDTLASLEHVTIKPYASFHTMWEMFDEMLRLAGEGDDDAEQMGFDTTEDASAADAVAGGADLDEESLAAVQSGVPYVGYTDYAAESIQEYFLPDVQIGYTDGIDCLGYVTYPEETLVNASYIRDGDDIFYSSSTNYFTALPEGARILVQRDGSRATLEGYLVGDEESRNAFLNGIMGFSYEGPDKDGNEVNITLFANTMTERGHQRDEYAFISNALFASFLTETPYVSVASSTEF